MKLKRARKIHLLFFVLTVVLTFFQLASAAQALPTLTIGDAIGAPREQIVVPIQIDGITSIEAFNIVVLYDPEVLEPTGSYVDRVGTLTANYELFIANPDVPGEIQIGAATLNPTTSSGVLMKLLFTIKPEASSGSSIVNISLLDIPSDDLHNSTVIAGNVTVVVPLAVQSTTPADFESNIPINTQITATFSKDMNPTTINAGTFTIKDPKNASILGTIKYNNKTATYKPYRQLNMNTTYTAMLNTKVADIKGNKLPANYIWQFTTEPPDLRIPEVLEVTQIDSESNVLINTQITATFNKDMSPITINRGTFTIKDPKNASIMGTVTYYNKTATYKLFRPLNRNMTYTATLTTKITDQNKQTLPTNYVWQFTTEPPDLRTPEVIAITPEDNQTNVPLNAQITATFNKDMNPTTINIGTFTIKDQKNITITGTIKYNNKTATYKPYRQLNMNTTYTAMLNTKITDQNKQTLPTNYIWRFTTL